MTEKIQSFRVRFGGDSVTSGIESLTMTEELFSDAKAEARIAGRSFAGKVADFRPMSVIDDASQRLFTGWVDRLEIVDGFAQVRMRNGYQLEGRFDRLVRGGGVTPEEMAWSIGRIAGFTEESLHIQGFARIADRFHVAMPVRGVLLDGEPRFDRVRITQDTATIRAALDFVSNTSWVDELLKDECWAIATVEAGSLYDAEQEGVSLIHATLDRLVLESHYSFASSPDGELLPFRREDLFTDAQAVPVALVRAATRGGRAWIRTLGELAHTQSLTNRRVQLVGPRVGERLQFDEAIRAWRRALVTSDRVAAATAISEAIEFYAAGSKPSLSFSGEQVRALRKAVRTARTRQGQLLALTSAQRQRLNDQLGLLNQPSLKQRLRTALSLDEVPYTEDEIAVVWHVRDTRNNFLHGRSRDEPDEDELDLSRAFVNRLLVWWGRSDRIQDQTAGQPNAGSQGAPEGPQNGATPRRPRRSPKPHPKGHPPRR